MKNIFISTEEKQSKYNTLVVAVVVAVLALCAKTKKGFKYDEFHGKLLILKIVYEAAIHTQITLLIYTHRYKIFSHTYTLLNVDGYECKFLLFINP